MITMEYVVLNDADRSYDRTASALRSHVILRLLKSDFRI